MMKIFRYVVAVLPQILVLLLLGGALDLLGGFNHTDAGFSVLILLFLINPLACLVLLIIELINYRRFKILNKGTGSLLWRNIAIILFSESFATNLFILSQLKMH